MFVVEPPARTAGPAEDFPAGPLGALLSDIIVKGLRMDPADCLITPLVKCPVDDPENPVALPLGPCASLVRKEIELASPRLVLAMGLVPGQALTGLTLVMTRLRIKRTAITSLSIPLRTTFGLSSMLAEPVLKKEVWRDLKVIFGLN
jgi:DNA polymerase